MKKLLLVAICVMAVMNSCKQKGQTAPADSSDSLTAVIDSIIEENDTTPLPMFLIGGDEKYMHMLYWANIEEPQRSEGDEAYFDTWHKSWELQEMFRRNAAQYTNRIVLDMVKKVRFVDEVLKDPDGNTPSIGEIHGRGEIPALCARFEYVNPKDNNPDEPGWGTVICTDSYLKSRKQLSVEVDDEIDTYLELPADVVKKMEKEYGMKALNSKKLGLIGGRYIHGSIEFQGEYTGSPRQTGAGLAPGADPDRKYALALELLIDSGKVYKFEQLGYYSEEYGTTWNADADGYIPNCIVAAFEGPKGLELCYTHNAPESFCVGMIYLRDGKLIEHEYEQFHSLIDEETPVWQKDFAEMKKLFLADDPHENKYVTLTKWAHCYVDYDNEWIWLRDKDDENGAIFLRDANGKFKHIATETPKLKFSHMNKGDVYYLQVSGSAGGPSIYSEVFAFKNGKQIEHFTAIFIYGEIDGCELNGKELSKEAGQAYYDNLPEAKEFDVYFNDIERNSK